VLLQISLIDCVIPIPKINQTFILGGKEQEKMRGEEEKKR